MLVKIESGFYINTDIFIYYIVHFDKDLNKYFCCAKTQNDDDYIISSHDTLEEGRESLDALVKKINGGS